MRPSIFGPELTQLRQSANWWWRDVGEDLHSVLGTRDFEKRRLWVQLAVILDKHSGPSFYKICRHI